MPGDPLILRARIAENRLSVPSWVFLIMASLSVPAAPTLLNLRRHMPLILYGVRLWASVCLALYVAFSLELDNPSWAGTSAAIVCQPVLGASLRKGWFRLVGTLIGACMAVLLTACFPQSRLGFLMGLAVWSAICAFTSTLLRNFASYAAALAGYTAAIICTDEMGLVGGANGDAFHLAVMRASEICIGIVSAGVVLAGTDFGRSRLELGAQIRELALDIAEGLTHALTRPPLPIVESRRRRRVLHLRVAGLSTMIDQASGEISGLPFRPRTLQGAVDGLSVALSAWRSVTGQTLRMPDVVRPEIAASLPDGWPGDDMTIREDMSRAARRLLSLPAEAPVIRLVIDRAAEGLLGLIAAMNGVVLLSVPGRVTDRGPVARLRVPDLLPPVLNAWRAFLTIAGAALIWIVTAWPGGGTFVLFTAITVTLFSPREDAAYDTAVAFAVGTAATAVAAAIVAFAILPRSSDFVQFSAALALVLVPAGALSAQAWKQGMFVALAANFVPLLGPANPMTYDPGSFYNTASAILAGVGLGAMSFRLLPPLSPDLRAQRLLLLTLRDLRRLARGIPLDWEDRVYGRLAVMPDNLDELSYAHGSAALSVGSELIRLRRIAERLNLHAVLAPVLEGIAVGDSAAALQGLERLDEALQEAGDTRAMLRARGAICAMTEAMSRHADFFDQRVD